MIKAVCRYSSLTDFRAASRPNAEQARSPQEALLLQKTIPNGVSESGTHTKLHTAPRRRCDIAQDRAGIAHGLVGQVFAIDERQPLTCADVEVITRARAQGGVAIGTALVTRHTPLACRMFDVDPRLPAVQFPQQTAVQAQRRDTRQGFAGVQVGCAGVIA